MPNWAAIRENQARISMTKGGGTTMSLAMLAAAMKSGFTTVNNPVQQLPWVNGTRNPPQWAMSQFLWPWQPIAGAPQTQTDYSYNGSTGVPNAPSASLVIPVRLAALCTYKVPPGAGGGLSPLLKPLFMDIVAMFNTFLPQRFHKYTAIVLIAVISYFTAGALTSALLAFAPEIGSAIAGELAGELVGKVITPGNLIPTQLPKINPKSVADLQAQLASYWDGLENNPIAGLAASYASALRSAAAGDHAPLLAVSQSLTRLMTVISTALSLAWLQEFDALYTATAAIPGYGPSYYYQYGINPGTGWSTDQWFNWSMSLGPGSVPWAIPAAPIFATYGYKKLYYYGTSASTRDFGYGVVGPTYQAVPFPAQQVADWNTAAAAQNASNAPELALLAAFARVKAPAWVGPWMWAAIQKAGLQTAAKTKPIVTIVVGAFHVEFQAALTALAAAQAAARVAAAKTAEEQATAKALAKTSSVASAKMTHAYGQYGPFLIGTAAALKAYLAGYPLL